MVTRMSLLDIGDVGETHCIPCLKGKTTCKVIPKKYNVKNPRRLHRIFSDVCGPLNVKGYSRCCYFITFVDGYSHFMKVIPIRTKDKVSEVLTDWIICSEIETGEKVNFLRTDGGSEYIESIFQNWLRTKGIHHKRINPGTLQENGMVEQLNRTVLEMTRSMLFDTELPRAFWTFVVNYSQKILNRLPTRALSKDITPFELFFQKKPSIAHLRVFGCPVYVMFTSQS